MIVLDSDVLIDLVGKEPEVVAFLERLWHQGEPLATTSLNVAEILRGVRGQRDALETTIEVLEGLTEVPFGPRASHRFSRLMHQLDREGDPIPVVDGMIAAVALEEGARVLTRNVRDFDRIPGLEVESPHA